MKVKVKIRRSPKLRKNKKKKYKFIFNKKTKINSLTHKKNYIINYSDNGHFCIKFKESCQLRYYQIRKIFNRLQPLLKKYQVDIWFYANFSIPLTAKPLIRMGTGKGKFRYFVSKYKKGDLFLSFDGIFKTLHLQNKFCKQVRCIMPVHTKLLRHLR